MPVLDKTAITGVDITTYLVKDLDRALAFWRDTMGLKTTLEYAGAGAEFTFEDGTSFGLYKLSEDDWHPSAGVLFRVGDLQASVDLYKSKGVRFEDDGKIEDTPMCYLAFATDSEGNQFILHQRK